LGDFPTDKKEQEVARKIKLFSLRETEVITGVSQGQTSTEIGKTLGISRKTVDHHATTAAVKMKSKNRAHTVGNAMKTHEIEGCEKKDDCA
jgi:DNA-binding NarL/FixJ family response regulator